MNDIPRSYAIGLTLFLFLIAAQSTPCARATSLRSGTIDFKGQKLGGITIYEDYLTPTERPIPNGQRRERVHLKFPSGSQPLIQENIPLRIGIASEGPATHVSVSLLAESWFKIRAVAYDLDQQTVGIEFGWNDQHPELSKLSYYDSPARPTFDAHDLATGVGSLHIDRKYFLGILSQRLSGCTAFAIAPQVVLTNHHCISTPEECENAGITFWIRDPRTGQLTSRHEFSCRQILQTDGERDFTLLMLNRPLPDPYKPLPLARRKIGLRENTKLAVLSMFPPEVKRSRICSTESRMLGMDTTLDPRLKQKLNPAVLTALYSVNLKPCDIRGGDSGSPILNFEGEVVGLLHSLNTATTLVSPTRDRILPSSLFVPIHEIVRVAAPVLDEWAIPYAR